MSLGWTHFQILPIPDVKIPTPGRQFIGEKSRSMFDYKTVVNWPARYLTACIHIHHISSYLYGTILFMDTIQAISWCHNYPPLFCYSTLYSHSYGSRVLYIKTLVAWNYKGLQTSIYTRNDEIAHSGNPYNEWSVHRMIVSFFCKCLAFISDETKAERPIGLRMSAYANSEDREVVEFIMDWELGNVGVSLVCFFVVFLVFVIWLASAFGLVLFFFERK